MTQIVSPNVELHYQYDVELHVDFDMNEVSDSLNIGRIRGISAGEAGTHLVVEWSHGTRQVYKITSLLNNFTGKALLRGVYICGILSGEQPRRWKPRVIESGSKEPAKVG